MRLSILSILSSLAALSSAVCPPLTAPEAIARLPPRDLPNDLSKRDFIAVLDRMAIVATNLIHLTATVNTLEPDSIATTAIVGSVSSQALILAQHVRDVIATANASTAYTAAESACQARANKYHFGLITNMTDAIVAKKTSWASAIFEKGDVSLTIRNAILTEKNLVLGPGSFAEAVSAKSVAGTACPEKNMGPFFENAAAQFDKCTGDICLPPFIPVMGAESLPGVPFDKK